GRGVDKERVFGSSQVDEFKSHTHEWDQRLTRRDPEGGGQYVFSTSGESSRTSSVGAHTAGGSETRPRNIALIYIIKI
ncbi:MAG: hypothetical protein ACI8WB_006163, partial [Phenylobacterium sp.]